MAVKTLSEFQDFLFSRNLVSPGHVSYHVYWVKRFLAFSNTNKDMGLDLKIRRFLNQLNIDKNITDSQIHQAETALKLYINNFLDGDTSIIHPDSTQNSNFDYSETINRLRQAIAAKHYSYKTERSYTGWVERFFDYLIRTKHKNVKESSPALDDLRDYLSYLELNQKVSASTRNQAFNALLFFYRNILNINLEDLDKTARAKRDSKLPLVLSPEEIQELFKGASGKNLLILQLFYGTGLRLMELARLRVKDIDFDSGLVFVRGAKKGDKDRTTILPKSIKEALSLHLSEVKALHAKDLEQGYGQGCLPDEFERKYSETAKEWAWQYVFPAAKLSADPAMGAIKRHHLSEKSIQNAVKAAVGNSSISKAVTVHTLRHSFALRLLMNGVNLREIQRLLGHKNIETTMVYTHVLRDMSNTPKSPLDELYPAAQTVLD